VKRILSAPLLATVENARNVLAVNGVESEITNKDLGMAAGELPPIETWPQLWVADEDFDRASRLVEPHASPEEWHCPKCREIVEGQFGQCWNCGTPRPS